MPTAYTSLLGLALPVTGELSGVWGTTVNDSITSLLDSAVAGTTNVSTDADVTLTTTTGAANQAREAILLFSGARTALRTITAPAQSKIYTVINATTGGYSVKLVGVGPTTGVTIVAGESAVCAWNGSDFVKVSNTGGTASFTNVTVTGTTTLSGLTASTALALDASKNVVSVTNTGTGNNVLATSPTLSGTTTIATLNLTNALGTTYGGTGLTSFTSGGVVYASSSSALATGSALTFDGTTLNNSGAFGTSTAALTLKNSSAANSSNIVEQQFFAANSFSGLDTIAKFGALNPSAGANNYGTFYWSLANAGSPSEQMRLTSTGLGIGTSSPASKLHVSGSFGSQVRLQETGGTYFDIAAGGRFDLKNAAGTTIVSIAQSGSPVGTQLNLDSSGNLGLGVTPNTWYSTFRAFQFGGNGSSLFGRSENNTAAIGSNVYVNAAGSNTYINTNTASYYQQLNGQHQFYNAPSGTAGNAITFTQAMTLDASGNLGIGTSSPISRLDVRAPAGELGRFAITNSGVGYLLVGGGASTTEGLRLSFDNSDGSSTINNFYNAALKFSTNNTERARIDSSGNFLVGTTSSNLSSGSRGVIEVNGTSTAYIGLDTGGTLRATFNTNGSTVNIQSATLPLTFGTTGGTEWARFDSSGNLLVNGTSSSSSTARVQAFVNGGNGATGYVGVFHSGSNLANQTAGYMIGKTDLTITSVYDGNGNPRNNIYVQAQTNGVYLASGGVAWIANSDERLKDIIEPISDAANKISSLRAVIGKYKNDAEGTRRSFLIAQDVQAVLPEAVDATNPEKLGVSYTDVIPLLVAAIKELKAENDSLKARLDAANL